MSKRIYVLVWRTESGDRGIAGYWGKPLTEEEQHGYFAEHHPGDYTPFDARTITWEMVELRGESRPVPLDRRKWAAAL